MQNDMEKSNMKQCHRFIHFWQIKGAIRHVCFCYEAIQVLNNDVTSSTEVTMKYYRGNGNKKRLVTSKMATWLPVATLRKQAS